MRIPWKGIPHPKQFHSASVPVSYSFPPIHETRQLEKNPQL